MQELTTLISGADFIILFFYGIVGFFTLKLFVFKGLDTSLTKLLLVFFILKLIAAAINILLIIFYWKTGDAIAYYAEAANLIALIKQDFTNIKYIFLPVDDYNSKIVFDNTLVMSKGGASLESNFMVTRFCTILYPLSMGKILIINFWFCFISAIAQFKLYLFLIDRYPNLKKAISLSFLFMPTMLLYASPIFKETLCFVFICFAIYSYSQIIKGIKWQFNFFILVLNIFLIILIKAYVFYAFIIAVFAVYLFKLTIACLKGSVIAKLFIVVFLTSSIFLIVKNVNYFEQYVISFVDDANFYQLQYNNDYGESSSFELGEIETTIPGLIKKIPSGIYNTYFRPHLWEVNKPIMLLSAIESFFILALTIFAFIKKGRYFRELLKNDSFLNIMFYYVIILGALIGLTTFNFGTLVRYKVPAVPFLWLFVFALLFYKPSNKLSA